VTSKIAVLLAARTCPRHIPLKVWRLVRVPGYSIIRRAPAIQEPGFRTDIQRPPVRWDHSIISAAECQAGRPASARPCYRL